MNKKLVWEIYNAGEVKKMATDFALALNNKNSNEILPFLKDAKFIRSLVVRRGENDLYFNIMEKGFNFYLSSYLKKDISLQSIPAQDLVLFLHNNNIPEQILNELLAIAYHKREEDKFIAIANVIKEADAFFENRLVLIRAMHDTASWCGSHGDVEKSNLENKKALELVRLYGDIILEEKIKYGLTYNKSLKPKLATADFDKYSSNLETSGNSYDALMAKIKMAEYLLIYAETVDKKERDSVLYDVKNFALSCLKKAKDIDYPNAEIRARELLGSVYKCLEDLRKEKSFKKIANNKRKIYNYKTE